MREAPEVLRRYTMVGISCAWFCLRKLQAMCERLMGGTSGSSIIILAYHGVRADQRERFAWQMELLRKAGRPRALGEALCCEAEGLAIVVTFDDAFANLVGNAFPELAQRAIPATVFVPSGNLGRSPLWYLSAGSRAVSEDVMNAEQVGAVASSKLFAVGSHTVRHTPLTELDDDDLDHELRASKVDLERLTGASVDSVALPYGAYDGRVLDHAERAGYKHALSIEPVVHHPGEQSFLMGRVRVEPNDWRVEFWLKIRGGYEWVAILHRLGIWGRSGQTPVGYR